MGKANNKHPLDTAALVDAIYRSEAVIEFAPDGTIVHANDAFLEVVGYSLDEVRGQHHRIFVFEEEAESADYREFWKALAQGEYRAGRFRRKRQDDKPVWLRATYHPVLGEDGKPIAVVKTATDVSERVLVETEWSSKLAAISRTYAVIEFELDGTIITANDNFLQAMGYTLDEVAGQHHRIFVEPEHASSEEYAVLWQALQAGECRTDVFKRLAKDKSEVWIQASYAPILDAEGEPFKVVKYATDITEQIHQAAEFEGKSRAISRSQAVIEFELDGTIITANDNFLNAMGYTLDEVVGQHHRMFVEAEHADSEEYAALWESLRAGDYRAAAFKRIAKDGSEVWIQASYNLIFDAEGRPFKVVKFATDITEQIHQTAEFEGKTRAMSRSQAVIEFELDGTIITANDNFLNAMGYTLDEVVGQHHRIFVEAEHADSEEYAALWESLREGDYRAGAFKRIAKDGSEVWIQASYNPIFDAEGRPFKVVKFATDITEQVRGSEQLKILSLVANETSNSVIITDATGCIEYVNPGFSRITGFSQEEAIGKKPGALLQGPDTNPETVARIRQRLADQEAFYEEILNYNKDGESYWISMAVNPVFDEHGTLEHHVSVQAVVDSVKLESLEAAAKLASIDRANAVCQLTLDGKMVDVNDKLAELLGRSVAAVEGTHLADTLENPSLAATILEQLGRGESADSLIALTRADGSLAWMDTTISPIKDLRGATAGAFLYGSDSTQSKQAQDTTQAILGEATRVMEAVSGGDLHQRVNGQFTGEFARLQAAINDCCSRLSDLVDKIGASASTISERAHTVAQGNTSLSERTTEQASSLEQTAAAMEQMSSTVRSTADSASQAKALAAEACSSADTGGRVVGTAIQAMEEINQSSRKIADIIGVIDEIAFQTNLLALNAAVEAARAGSHGQGFAVVASEVRNLAQRSATAAGEIKKLISESVSKVDEGSRIVNGSGETLEAIVTSVSAVTDMIAQIAKSAGEQSLGVEQISETVNQMDTMTQQNAALVEQTSDVSIGLNKEAAALRSLIDFFDAKATAVVESQRRGLA